MMHLGSWKVRVRTRASAMRRHLPALLNRPYRRVAAFFEVNWFAFTVLRDGNKLVLALSLIATLSGFASFFAIPAETLLSLVLASGGLIGVFVTVRSALKTMFRTPSVRIFINDTIAIVMPQIILPADYLTHDYSLCRLPLKSRLMTRSGDQVPEFIVRSRKVDAFVRSDTIALTEDQSKVRLIDEKLRKHADVFELALRRKAYDCVRQIPPEDFHNGVTACLANDVFPTGGAPLRLYPNSYYKTFLTTDFVYRGIETVDARPFPIYDGSTGYPAVPGGNGHVLMNIAQSVLSNHIGVSTLVMTRDRQLVIWEQSVAAGHSQERLAPTGSGSCDWADWLELPQGQRNLAALLSRAMEREFREESHGLHHGHENAGIETRIIGFFRWLRRGGKPEFVGISATIKESHELEPNPEEVTTPQGLRLLYPANTIEEFAQSVDEMLADRRLSVPLWVLLTCIQESLKESYDFFTEASHRLGADSFQPDSRDR